AIDRKAAARREAKREDRQDVVMARHAAAAGDERLRRLLERWQRTLDCRARGQCFRACGCRGLRKEHQHRGHDAAMIAFGAETRRGPGLGPRSKEAAMRARRVFIWTGAAVVAACVAVSVSAQSTAKPAYTPPKTAWGDPDFQGIWPSTAMVGVPFERPAQFGARLYLTDEEFKQRQKEAERQTELDNESFSVDDVKAEVVAMGDVGGQTSPPPFWLERGEPSRQSSLIVDPPDGRLPPMTPDGQRRVATTKNTYLQYTGFNAASELGPYDRCISRCVLGSIFPVIYNNGHQR